MNEAVVLTGCEAVAHAAIDAGITAAYSYPGTPSTEILAHIFTLQKKSERKSAWWTANEKTAYEAALGVSLTGGRVLVAMKHVGLNVAADPFINSALTKINGGLVLAVADDPGMHSSQNEQDSRYYADFARVICLEPSCQQEAYAMTCRGFELSETCHIPVVLRLVTRIAHGRSSVITRLPETRSPHSPHLHRQREWVLLPSISRELWANLVEQQDEYRELSENSAFNTLTEPEHPTDTAVITTGVARQYYLENRSALSTLPAHLHIGMYPLPERKIRDLAARYRTILVIEEGYPYVERFLRGLAPLPITIHGRIDKTLPPTGELSPESVRTALGLPARETLSVPFTIPERPPKFCQQCPHIDSFNLIREVIAGFERPLVAADIGCYTLEALQPSSVLDSTICMGASIGMAIGAADNGIRPSVAVIGDSTFLHTGIQALCDARSKNSPITVIILDNEVVAMTGGQDTIVPSHQLSGIVSGCGVDPEHLHLLEAAAKRHEQNTAVLKKEIMYEGLSVIIMHRACIVAVRRKRGTP